MIIWEVGQGKTLMREFLKYSSHFFFNFLYGKIFYNSIQIYIINQIVAFSMCATGRSDIANILRLKQDGTGKSICRCCFIFKGIKISLLVISYVESYLANINSHTFKYIL